MHVPDEFTPAKHLANEAFLGVQREVRVLDVVDHTPGLEASKVEQGRDAGVKQRAVLHGHCVLVRTKPRHGLLEGPAPCALRIGRGSGQVFGRDAARVVTKGGFDHRCDFFGDGIRWKSRDLWQGNGSVPRQPVFRVQGPLSSHRLALIGQQDSVSFPRLAIERVHPPRTFVSNRAVEQRPVGQPTPVVLNRQQPPVLQWFEGEPSFPLGPTHRVQWAERFDVCLEDGLVGSVVMDDDDRMSCFLGFERKMTQVGQHERQFLLVIGALPGLP